MDVEKEYLKAGKIASEARELGARLVKEGVKYLEVAKRVEKFILKRGGKFAFPINISVNEIAAHDSPRYNDQRVFKEGDVVKIDVGVHINGYIADTAETVEVKTHNYKDMIRNNKEVLHSLLKQIKKDSSLGEIGKFIQNFANNQGYNVIVNLSGHQLEKYNLHAGINIPNYDNKSSKKIGIGAFAIEPFFTKGKGEVIHDTKSSIYRIEVYKKLRIQKFRKILDFIYENYKTLPFSKRWVIEKFGESLTNFAFDYFFREGILVNYPKLKEISNNIVTQFEHTVLIEEDKITITTS